MTASIKIFKNVTLKVIIGLFLINSASLKAQTQNTTYEAVKKELIAGWNTWSTYSMGQHVLLPYGFSINLALKKSSKNSDGFVNRFFVNKKANGWSKPIVKPGYHSYSGDYSAVEIVYRKVTFTLETAAYGEDFYLLIQPKELDPDYDMSVILEAGVMWNKEEKAYRSGEHLILENNKKQIKISASQTPKYDPFIDSYAPNISLVLNKSIGISTTGSTIDEIQQKIAEKKTAYLKYIQQFGDLSESYAGMSSSLAWNTIYDPKHNRVFSTVDRGWNKSRGGYVFFGWDNFFMAQMIGLDSPKLAMANAIEALNEVTEEGFVSNNSQANGRKSWDRSQPPVGSMMSWQIYQKHPEKWFLEEVYPKLLRWNDWWIERRLNGDLLSWGSHKSKNPYGDSSYVNLKAAIVETGIDDSPMYVDASFDVEKGLMLLHDVGLNAMYIGDCEALIQMAKVLGKEEDEKRLKKRVKQFKKQIQSLWNKENGLFQNYDLVKQSFINRISPTSFYPMIAGTAKERQVKQMINEHLLNEDEFWGEWVLPSISKKDPLYPKQKYWKGAIWAPMNFLVYIGMQNYDSIAKERKEFVKKSVDLFNKNWRENGFVCENYSPIDGTCTHERLQSSSWYTWGGMMAIMALMEEGYY